MERILLTVLDVLVATPPLFVMVVLFLLRPENRHAIPAKAKATASRGHGAAPSHPGRVTLARHLKPSGG